jgi:hypothetical protein
VVAATDDRELNHGLRGCRILRIADCKESALYSGNVHDDGGVMGYADSGEDHCKTKEVARTSGSLLTQKKKI